MSNPPTTNITNILERIPPQNIEAEQSFLGSLLIDKDAITKIIDAVHPEDCYRDAHRIIFEAMLDLFERREPIDILSLTNILDARKQLELIGGRGYLVQLTNAVPTAAHIMMYAGIVQKKSTLRRLINAASQIAQLGYQEDDETDILLDQAESSLFAVSQKHLKKTFASIRDVLTTAFERIDELHKGQGKLRGITTGFRDLDSTLSGFQNSDLIVLAARPSVGKTSLALDFARIAATRAKAPVGIFSLEMSRDQLVDRMLCAESRVDLWKMRTGRLSERPEDDDFPRIGHAMGVLAEAPIFIDDNASSTIMEMRAKARRLQSEHGLKMLVVDYLQLMEGRGKEESRVQEISQISRGLKGIARELNIPVLALSQLSRGVESRSPAIPKLADLRDSGCLSGETLITRADTGARVPIRDLVGEKDIPVFSLTDDYKIEVRKMTKVFSSGTKQCFTLKTRSGRRIRASANHPFRTIDGWVRLDALTPDTHIAVIEEPQLRDKKITWDAITSIEPDGEEEVFDATVPGTHNFIANDVVVHNSIEQDADIVMFIYRKSSDKSIRDLMPEEKNIAQIYISKHRNGPTGVVDLYFDEGSASFRDVEKRQSDPFGS